MKNGAPKYGKRYSTTGKSASIYSYEFTTRGELQKREVTEVIGSSIRGLANRGRFEMLDQSIRFIVNDNGPYWPPALDSIKTTLEFDSSKMEKESIGYLKSWLQILSPENASLIDKLQILVIDPPWEAPKIRRRGLS